MNIAGIATEVNASYGVRGNEPDNALFGKKGDIIEGVVKEVSDKITIDFNGKEINISKSAVQDAREGSSIKFQIMDVSNDRIVLKPLENRENDVTNETGGVTHTSVETSSTTDILEPDAQDNEVRSEKLLIENNQIENVTTEDVIEIIKTDEGVYITIEDYTLAAFDRLLQAVCDIRTMKENALEGQMERIAEVRETIEKSAIINRLPAGISEALAEYFVKYDIPVTEEKLTDLSIGMSQITSIAGISDRAVSYLLKNELEITASNIYNATYSKENLNESYNVDTYESMIGQIEGIVEKSGYEWDNLMKERTSFLFANDIPINEDTLSKQKQLAELQEEGFNLLSVAEDMIRAMSNGEKARDAVLMNGSDSLTDTDIQRINECIDRISRDTGSEIKARRQLEEIRLTMTISAARKLADKGIDIDTAKLEEIVDNLRQIEREQYSKELSAYGMVSDEETDIVTATEHCRREISIAPSYLLKDIAETAMKDRISDYADKAVLMTEEFKRAEQAYEPLMTAPRADMGDSINKAFDNMDSLLQASGIELTEENVRIVKVLAHNRMEITTENVDMLREYDARVQNVLENLKPRTTLEMIRRGINPLDVSLEELETRIEEINSDLRDSGEEGGEASRSRFLWKLEKEHRISEDERESYIGICRLLHQITGNDRAAIGLVVNEKAEFTLRNLMTAARSRKRTIDAKVDEEFGLNEGAGDTREIEAQINAGFRYEERLVNKLSDSITPSKLYELAGENVEKLLDTPVKHLLNDVLNTEENRSVENEYAKYLAELVRETGKDEQAIQYVNAYNIEPTIYNINAARQYIDSGESVLKKLLGSFDRESEEKLLEETDKIIDSLTDEDAAGKQFRLVSEAAKQLLMQKEKGKIDNADLASIKAYESGLKIMSLRSRRRSYEIPVVTESGVTSINLTLVAAGKDKSSISINMESEIYGNITCKLDLAGEKVKGLLLTENRMENGILSEMVKYCIENNGYSLISFNEAVHREKINSLPVKEKNETVKSKEHIKKMYTLSKDIVKAMSDMIKEEQI